MTEEQTPFETEEFGSLEDLELERETIKWDEYTENDLTEIQEALDEWVAEHLVISKYVRVDYNGYIDYSFSEEETLEACIDADIEENDRIEIDVYDQEGADEYRCKCCDTKFTYASSFNEHAIDTVEENNPDLNIGKVLRPSQFLCLLSDHVWNDPNGKPYIKYMEYWIRSSPNRLHEFFTYMYNEQHIPQDLWDKYLQLLSLE